MTDEPPALVWPRLLELPSDTVNVVYLDLNHWIHLAQASVGHSKGSSFTKALEACRAARLASSALFVLSSTHYFEVSKIKDPEQRRALADIMEELTGFATLVSRDVVMGLELAAMLDRFAKEPSSLPNVSLIGRGVGHAFGLKNAIKIARPLGSATDRAQQRMGPEASDDFIAQVPLLFERSLLRGPTGKEVEDLRKRGWNPEAAMQVAETRAAEEREQRLRFDAQNRWRRGRLRDVVAARELSIEFRDIFPRALKERGLMQADVLQDRQSARAFVRGMPSTEVAIELKTAWHRNRDKHWTVNDIQDIDAMSLAVPYCDIVVSDKACHQALAAAHLGKRMNTVLLWSLEDLPNTLAQWKPKRPPAD